MRSSVLSYVVRTPHLVTQPRAVARRCHPLRPADLLRLTDEGAEDVLAGRYDHLLPPTAVARRRALVDPAATPTTTSTSG